ncbi:MAG: hypothetical protein FWD35_04490 [Oscillospiraceae bacterium]|nr:hypothetical protein [Oscillospiraceae bacterium]
MKKQLLSILLTPALLFALAACTEGGSNADVSEEPETSQTPATTRRSVITTERVSGTLAPTEAPPPVITTERVSGTFAPTEAPPPLYEPRLLAEYTDWRVMLDEEQGLLMVYTLREILSTVSFFYTIDDVDLVNTDDPMRSSALPRGSGAGMLNSGSGAGMLNSGINGDMRFGGMALIAHVFNSENASIPEGTLFFTQKFNGDFSELVFTLRGYMIDRFRTGVQTGQDRCICTAAFVTCRGGYILPETNEAVCRGT